MAKMSNYKVYGHKKGGGSDHIVDSNVDATTVRAAINKAKREHPNKTITGGRKNY